MILNIQLQKVLYYLVLAAVCEGIVLANGEVTYNTSPLNGNYTLGTTASFQCNDQYYLQGSQSSTCELKSTLTHTDYLFCIQGNQINRSPKIQTPFNLNISYT